jgi:DNA-binding LacI/PurR family transcriptional regulator
VAVTIRDVAKEAGVGVGTVSRVLNNSPYVSESTRRRVLAVMRRLDYHPSPTARRLSLGRTHTIGVIVPFFTRPAFVERLSGIQAELSLTHYELILFSVDTPEKRDEYFANAARFRQVDGLIVIALGLEEKHAENLKNWALPVVLLDTTHPELPSIVVADEMGGRIATQHLIEKGHRRIAYICDHFDNAFGFTSSRRRYQGYREALEAAGIPFRAEYMRQGEHGRYVAHQITSALLDLPEPPTAIFAASDTQAMGAMEAIRSRNMTIPDDISVIGYDDIEIAEYLNLTTVSQPMYNSGQQAVTWLLDLIDESEPEQMTIEMPVEVIERATTGPPKEG